MAVLSLVFLIYCCIFLGRAVEPTCPVCSKYDYDERLLERVIKNELTFQLLSEGIQKTNEIVQSKLADLKSKTEEAKSVVERTNVLVDNTERTLAELTGDTRANVSETIMETRRQLQSLQTQAREFMDIARGKIATPTVVFQSQLTGDTKLTKDDLIVYSHVIANEGEGYDVTTGHFVAPFGGLYALTGQVCARTSIALHIAMTRNADVIHAGVYHGDGSVPCHGINVYAQLDKDDQVSMKCSWGECNLRHQDGYRLTSFGGALIHT
ncbi:hypothetical protein MAR_036378 [Mya arenaria]|uniref:C1q domain-containing protein n=1 Tax=Mya arenaria TaxID=6604 RepID=A0ABY7FN15_MYAAR|nr:uncharacterized protein LOC128214441 [Mya arenaria]WAR22709.1 hypothetical protein MAR_036378 [Mya arenaria]